MKKLYKTIVVLTVATLLFMVFSSCQEDPVGVADIDSSLPEITSISSGTDKMLAGSGTDVNVKANQGSSYQWSADAGSFGDASAASTTWSSEGITASSAVKLTCNVSNGSGSSKASVTIQVVVSTTPTFHWPFDNNLTDVIAGNNGTATALTFNSDALEGAASAEFTGEQNADAIMTVANDADVAMGPADYFTFAVWVKTESDVGLMFGRQAAIDEWNWDYDKSFIHEGEWLLYRAHGWRALDADSPAINDGEWHLLCVTHFGESDLYELYVDGELIADGGLYYDEPTQSDEGTTFYFGGMWGDDDFTAPYEGLMDEFKYYNVVLTPAEIALLSVQE